MKTNNQYGIDNDASTESANAEVRQHGEAESIRDTTSHYLGDANQEKTLRDRHCLTMKAAQDGSAEAQFWVGINYRDGWGVTQDAVKAAEWMRRAAEQGHPGAQVELGYMHIYGEGVEQDEGEAFKWFSRAADADNPVALCMMAIHYLEDDDEAHQEKAYGYFARAAEKGESYSQFMVASKSRKDEDAAQNRLEENRWRVESDERYPEAVAWLAKLIINGDMAAKYEGEEIALLKLAAAHGNKEAEELLHQYNGEMQG